MGAILKNAELTNLKLISGEEDGRATYLNQINYIFLKVAIPLEWILSIYQIIPIYKSLVGITTNNFKYSDVLVNGV